MSMGRRRHERQQELWIASTEIPDGPGHPFYHRLNELLSRHGFDEYVEGLCAKFYHGRLGRPGIPPGVYFRMLLLGYFEGIDSERGIAWRCADSLALRRFLGYAVTEAGVEYYLEAVDASATSYQWGDVPFEASGKAQFDDIAALTGFEGIWLGQITSGQLNASVAGAVVAATPDNPPAN